MNPSPNLKMSAARIARKWVQAKGVPEEAEEESSSSGGRVSGKFLEFLEDTKAERVRNPDTGRMVFIKSLKGPLGRKLQQKLFQDWLGKQQGEDSKASAPKQDEAFEVPAKPKQEEAGTPPTKSDGGSSTKKPKLKVQTQGNFDQKALNKLFGRNVSEQDLATLCGAQGLGEGYSVNIIQDGPDSWTLEAAGPDLEHMERRIVNSGNGPMLVNEQVILYDDAPRGLGTKMLMAQAEAARSLGIEKIKTHAARGKDMVGYYVWPRLGYHGGLPPDVHSQLFDDIAAGKLSEDFYAVFDVHQLMLTPEGREWWKENGKGFDAVFNVQGDSYDILKAYMAAKSKKAAKSKGKRSLLDDLDEAALDKVWLCQTGVWKKLVDDYRSRGSKKPKKKADSGTAAAARNALCKLLSQLRALQQTYWTAHWQATGTAAYGDHLLFERMYEAMSGEIDNLAEKIVASFGNNAVNSHQQLTWMAYWTAQWSEGESGVFEQVRDCERQLQQTLKQTLDLCERVGICSVGLKNYLEDLADKHETNLYLIGQRLTPRRGRQARAKKARL